MIEHLRDPAAELADRYDDRVALRTADGGDRTYADLDRRARRVAGWLAEQGVGAGDRVATLAGNRVELVEALLACAKRGAILAPLNVRLPADELEPIADRIDPALVLADGQHLDRLGTGVPTVDLDVEDPVADPPETVPGVAPGDPALILLTGGTTGTPKGAVIPWRAIVANARNTVRGWGLQPDDRTPLIFPMFHTGGWNVTTLPLLYLGGTTDLMAGFDPGDTIDLVEERRATILVGVPAMFRKIKDHPRFGEADLSSVRLWISGGAPCPVPLMETYWKEGYGLKMGYGLTEAGPNNFHIPADRARQKPRSVGRPLPGVETRVVDPETGEGVPVGERGELLIAGDHVFDRYWRAPEETEAAFVDDRWLRTGDVARVDGEGDHFIVDRIKEMFISGGENVYPVEVESVLEDHPDVERVAVVGVPDERWGEVGRAVVEPVGSTVDPEEIRAFAAERLAKYKVPKHVDVVGEMPLTPAGKIDKQALKGDRT